MQGTHDTSGPALAISVPATDAYALAAAHARPSQPNGRVVLINSALGVPHAYYARYAERLAARGFDVLSYDYRGIAGSRPARLRGFKARAADFASHDYEGMLRHALALRERRAREGLPAKLLVVGHSIGGQIAALAPSATEVDALMLVGAQIGDWRLWPHPRRAGIWLFAHALLPAVSHAVGFFPGRALRLGEDLPAGVAQEWARWMRTPGYYTGHHRADPGGPERLAAIKAFRAPVLAWCVADDGYAPPQATEALLSLFESTQVERRRPSPSQLGVARIGHFGFFRERFAGTLWQDSADWLARA
jgi:predicted alpha/beta hydrolase